MIHTQITTPPKVTRFDSLKPGDAFIFPEDLSANRPIPMIVIESLESSDGKFKNAIDLEDGSFDFVPADLAVIAIRADLKWTAE